MLDFVQSVINSFSISSNLTRVGLVRFSNTAAVTFNFDEYQTAPQLIDAVFRLELQGGETNTSGAFREANAYLFPNRRPNVDTICIILTDGQPNIDNSRTFTDVNQTKALGIDVFAIGITNLVSLLNC